MSEYNHLFLCHLIVQGHLEKEISREEVIHIEMFDIDSRL